MRFSLRAGAAGAETGKTGEASAESVGARVCATQPIAVQRATTSATWALRITLSGRVGNAVVTLSLETTPKGYLESDELFRTCSLVVPGV